MSELFDKDFLWGAATASAQVEGGWNENSRTPSIWDNAPKGRIKNGDNCHIACDHFHRYKEDIALMKELGLKSYRFSVSWSRVQPKKGEVSKEGLGFYIDLVKELKSAGIEPIVTIYHWDLPLWVHDEGGWLSEKIIPLFEQYTKIVVDALSDDVTYWIPMNEPQCFIMLGYAYAVHAPFKFGLSNIPKATRICMLAHAASVKTIRKYAKTPPKVGIAMAAGANIPKTESLADIEKARKKSFNSGIGLMNNRWWSDPILLGEPVTAFGVFKTHREDMKEIYQKLDFVGLNVYQPYGVSKRKLDDSQKTSMGWAIDGRVLYWTIRFYYDRYGIPIMITENGMANNDSVSSDGKVHDEKRIGFMKDYLGSIKRAVSENIPVLGYQYWSLMDNFEWAEGYAPRFGITYIDYTTQKRIIKDSGYYYKKVIETNGEIL
ncbi:MAG: family 1 glycosylhydrolase [Clostridia bacterium]|nr:family 1 glycosylhydrolase [Clostridia bacterium]